MKNIKSLARFFLLTFLLSFCKNQYSQVSTATAMPMSAANNTVSGGAWSNFFTNIGSFTTTAHLPLLGSTGVTQGLYLTNYNFSIPSTATIVGIQASTSYSASFNKDTIIRILVNGIETGNNLGGTHSSPGYLVPILYGSSSNLWGISNLSPSDVNSPNFGLCIYLKGGTGGFLAYAGASSYGPILTIFYQTAPLGVIEYQTSAPKLVPCQENALCIEGSERLSGDVEIYNYLGQLERKEKAIYADRIETLHLTKGIYFVKYQLSDNREYCNKIVID